MTDFDQWWENGGQRAVINPEPREFARAGWMAAQARAGHALRLAGAITNADADELELAARASGATGWHARNAGRRL